MRAATNHEESKAQERTASRVNQLCWLAALAAGWLWAWRHLSVEWRFNEQYQYGFAVPLLSLYIGWRRWASLSAEGGLRPVRPGWIARVTLLAGWSIYTVGEILRQHDPGWHLCAGAIMAGISAATFVWLYASGGWRLVRAMAFPVAFTWLALPWPSDLEHFLVTTLTRHLTSMVIFALNFCSIPTVQHGAVIGTARGFVGIDEACSGVQSFQSSFMAGLFLGEWFGLAVARRGGLVLTGWVIAFLGNFGRVLALTLLVNSQGEEAVPRYHDFAGYTSTCLIFAGIFFVAWRQRSGPGADAITSSDSAPPLALPYSLPGWDGIGLLAGAALAPLLAFAWFHQVVAAQIMPSQRLPFWRVAANQTGSRWKATSIPLTPAEKRMLRYSEGDTWSLRSQEGWEAELFHFFWKPGEGYPSITYIHTPNICMPNAGWNLDSLPEPVSITVHGAVIRGGLYRFSQGSMRELVFQTICYGGKTMSTAEDPYAHGTRSERFSMLWRKPHQQISEEMMVFTPASDAGALDLRLIGQLLESVLDPAAMKALAQPESAP